MKIDMIFQYPHNHGQEDMKNFAELKDHLTRLDNDPDYREMMEQAARLTARANKKPGLFDLVTPAAIRREFFEAAKKRGKADQGRATDYSYNGGSTYRQNKIRD